ncbi:MAG: peptidoglycan DD-metalloendopeptidase family protein [Bacteroidales bacterium]|nr:peptidoglycan DD-metalloendopeptidase family protein [Bacteroidales bacterium]
MKNLSIIILALLLFSCNGKKKNIPISEEKVAVDTLVIHPETKYGIIIDSLDIERKRIRRNEFLGTILENEGISSKEVYILSKKYSDVFDVRKVRVGGYYELFHTRDSVAQLSHFIYQKSIAELVIYDFSGDEVIASTWHKEVKVQQREASGIINNSLWQTIVDNGDNGVLAIEMSEIYAWSVDFFGIAKGDKFKIVYEEELVDSTSIGVKEIKYAYFKHKGDVYYAIPFEQNGTIGYFNQDGQSLKRAFLKAPLRFSSISSGFSNNRYHPVLKRYRAHHGVDYAAPSGTPVHTIGDGTIIKRGYQKNGGGNYIKIRHNSVYTTTYMHLKGFAKGMNVGAHLKQGQTIGYVGATGLATGPHLDFRVYRNGYAMNPLKVKSPPVEPILEANIAAFKLKRDSAMQALRVIKFRGQDGYILAEENEEDVLVDDAL